MKKLICTILALVIALSCFSVSVSANEITEDFPDEPIDDTPRAIVLPDIIDPGSETVDTDYDGVHDPQDGDVGENDFEGALYTEYLDGSSFDNEVAYTMDYRWFFSPNSNTTYNPDLATVSSLLSAIAYESNYINVTSGGSLTTTATSAMQVFMSFHGLGAFRSYTLAHTDNHVGQMFIANRNVEINGVEKTIVCVVIRGTNDSIKEWSSNYDVGPSTSDHSEWTNSHHHKSYDITANRLNAQLTTYLNTFCSGKNVVLWITGHSRGGALANLLAAKRINAGNQVFAYTFACPGVTDLEPTGTIYNSIFNVINEDDFITDLPMESTPFYRYGEDKSESIAHYVENNSNSSASAIIDYPVYDYYFIISSKTTFQSALQGTLGSRNNYCTYRSDGLVSANRYNTREEAEDAGLAFGNNSYPTNTQGTWTCEARQVDGEWEYVIYQHPAFLMQLIAACHAEVITHDVNKNFYKNGNLIMLENYLTNARDQYISYADIFFFAPHCSENYYYLTQIIT